jgi:hypothetical protein
VRKILKNLAWPKCIRRIRVLSQVVLDNFQLRATDRTSGRV